MELLMPIRMNYFYNHASIKVTGYSNYVQVHSKNSL